MSDSGDDIESIISRLHIIESGTTADVIAQSTTTHGFRLVNVQEADVTSTKEINMTIFVEFFALSMIFILCVLVGIDQWSERHQYYAAADPSFLDEAYPRDEA
jgi:hypothetical protein